MCEVTLICVDKVRMMVVPDTKAQSPGGSMACRTEPVITLFDYLSWVISPCMLRRGGRYIRFVGSQAGSPNNCDMAVSIRGLCFEHPMPGSLFISQQLSSPRELAHLLDSLLGYWPQDGPEARPVHPPHPPRQPVQLLWLGTHAS